MRTPAIILFFVANAAPMAVAQRGIELASHDGFWRLAVRPEVDLTYWHTDTPAPGLLSFKGTDFFEPQLTVGFSVMAGDEWLLHVYTRWDRGFEVGQRENGDFRADEVFLRWRPWGDGRLNVQAGKFATCFGNWVPRHTYWENPFLTPPLPYENLLAVNDRTARSPSTATIANRATGKRAWLPMIWGPSYATGASIFGSSEKWDYAVEVKNASLGSRPDSWSPWEENGSHPTVTGRLGYRPDAAWAFGISGSHGTYLRTDAEGTLLAGENRGDFPDDVIGLDLRWSHHHLQVLGEVIASRSGTVTAGDLDSLAYYLEGRWKVNSRLYLAGRWAQQWNDDFAPDGTERIRGYTREIWRATAAVGFRIRENVLAKAEYSYNGGDANENVFALGIGFRF